MLGETTMKTMKTRTVATLATVFLLALFGCQTESPTAPSTGGGGGTTPPTSDISITLTASNAAPIAGSSVVITAKATSAGASVVNGTAIEFATTFGTFLETAGVYALRTTNSGAATVTLTSADVGTAVVTARLGAVSKSITVNFRVNGGVGPQVSSVVPASGPPAGNQVVTINGSGFKAPVRVFFGAKEATIVSVTETQIKAITPSTNLAASDEFLEVDVRVIVEAGTANEASGTLTKGYRYELEILTPSIIHVSPASGPNEGNTRITIFGSGFQSPVKAFFGGGATQVELDVVSVSFSQIQAITPPASGMGSAFQNASVGLRVLNLASNKEATLPDAFRYGPKIEITGVSPAVGSHLGGERVTIFGFGFDDPVQVTLAGIPAQVIRVSGTEVVVLSGGLLGCASGGGGTAGEVKVTNLEQPSGEGTASLSNAYSYQVTTKILSVSPLPLVEGGAGYMIVDDPGSGSVKLTIGGKTVFPTPASAADPGASTRFDFTVPTGLKFDEQDCTTGGGVTGKIKVVTDFDVAFENILTGCKTSISIPIAPVGATCVTAPTISVTPPAGLFGLVAEGTSKNIVFTVTNIGGVQVSGLSLGALTAPFGLAAPLTSNSLAPLGTASFTISFSPPVTGTDTPYTGSVDVIFAGGTTVNVPLSGTGDAP
jgi:hypothetical protein